MIGNNPPSSRTALRRLVIVVAVLVGVLIYAYGWQVTDIDIEETQNPTRQASVQRALRELFAPDLFDQETESVFAEANFQMDCESGTPPAETPVLEDTPYIVITPTCGVRGDIVTVEGFNFEPHTPSALRWIPPAGQSRPLQPLGIEGNVTDTDVTGHFRVEVQVPSIRGSTTEFHLIEAEARRAISAPAPSQTTKTVIEKMIETIFLALMATTVAVPISVFLSFLAAHNLMREIRVPLGNVLVGVILLPVGWILGMLLLSRIGLLGVDWGKNLLMGIIGPAVAIAAYGVGAQAVNQMKLKDGAAVRLRSLVMAIILLVVVIFTLGAVGGLAIWVGDRLLLLSDSIDATPNSLGNVLQTLVMALGNFIGTLGRLIEIGIGFIAALAGALLLASNGMESSIGLLKQVRGAPGYLLGGVLGVLGGALMMIFVALIGTQGALLGLLSPLVAAILGSQILMLIYTRWFSTDSRATDRSIRTVLSLVGAVIAFAVTYAILDIGRSVINGRLPSAIALNINILGSQITLTEYVVQAAIIGAVLGGLAGILSGIHAAFPVGMITYNVTRTILNALRSIEPLIMGIVFVIWVGIGPFAGVLALTLHSIASLGKLYSEQIETIDTGPIEAILATGANRLQMIVYAVVPQIIPSYIAFTMYRWDINVRMSTIIGFVGGGGIGFLLQQQINNLRYAEAGVAVLAIAVVVSALDYASAYIRENLA
jgi:phosphonate ABC transporter permease subunit PhnE